MNPVPHSFTALAIATLAVLTGCAQVNQAPVEERFAASSPPGSADSGNAAPATRPPSADPVQNTNRPGYYTIQPGDVLYRIALETGHHWKDLARWNALDNPHDIKPGQVIRILPPPGEDAMPAPANTGVEVTPVVTPTVRPASPSSPVPAPGTPQSPPSSNPTPVPPSAQQATGKSRFIWPSEGKVIANFNGSSNKGVDIAGKEGDPVRAAASGKVVYAGSDLRGYGNLIIVQHDNTYLTAYAHNKKLLVSEDQQVRQGDKIAEMGRTDAERVKLHFELRRQGKPIDPLPLLPPAR